MDKHNKWLACLERVPNPTLRLFCCHYAGGSASFCNGWTKFLPQGIEIVSVQLPGREERFHEPFVTDMAALIAELAPAVRPYLRVPFAIFGHSMGAMVAYELSCELQRQFRTAPRIFFASGRQAPHFPEKDAPIHGLPDEDFCAAFLQRHATQNLQSLFADQEIRQMFVPQLRADMALVERYRSNPAKSVKLSCPVIALDCQQGAGCVDGHELAGWREHTSGPFKVYRFPGDHFFIDSAKTDVLAVIGAELEPFLQHATSHYGARGSPVF
jgi:medium-chain acyl-[acyl-carrier-protein] hydrolase